MYLDLKSDVYTLVYVSKLKVFLFTNNKLSNLEFMFDKMIIVLNYIQIENNNPIFSKMVSSKHIAYNNHNFKTDP